MAWGLSAHVSPPNDLLTIDAFDVCYGVPPGGHLSVFQRPWLNIYTAIEGCGSEKIERSMLICGKMPTCESIYIYVMQRVHASECALIAICDTTKIERGAWKAVWESSHLHGIEKVGFPMSTVEVLQTQGKIKGNEAWSWCYLESNAMNRETPWIWNQKLKKK